MARDLGPLPGGQSRVGLLAQPGQAALEPGDLVAQGRRFVARGQLGDAGLQLEPRLLEVKRVRHTPR